MYQDWLISIRRKYMKLYNKCYTAYSENKGEKLAFCTTTTKEGNKLIDENTLMFVRYMNCLIL